MVDPALAALAEFKAAHRAWRRSVKRGAVDKPFFDDREQKLQALGDVTPTTPQGAIALMKALMKEEGYFIDANSPIRGAINNLLAFIASEAAHG